MRRKGDQSRAADERLLSWIAARAAGQSSAMIARANGCTAAHIRTVTNRVRDDDARISGEDIEGHYW